MKDHYDKLTNKLINIRRKLCSDQASETTREWRDVTFRIVKPEQLYPQIFEVKYGVYEKLAISTRTEAEYEE